MNFGYLLTGAGASMISIIYIVMLVAFFYFFLIRPQKNEEKKKAALLATLEIGDSVLTSSGFYGVVIDIEDDTVIVEFGSNKNCRIPMQRSAIVQIEKPEDAIAKPEDENKESGEKEKKGFLKK